ncbi:MAG: efflux RND transporter permease subunit [Bacteroidales bacterium]
MKTILEKSIRFPWLVMVIITGLSAYFLIELRMNGRMETNLDEYMPKTHPAFIYSDQAEEWFNIKDGILIAIEHSESIYNSQTLQKIREISEQLQAMPEFDDNDVISLYTADNITGSEYDLEVKAFYRNIPASLIEMDDLRNHVRGNEMVFRRLVSEDETVALIVAGMESSEFTQEFYRQMMQFAHSFESDSEKIYVAGRPIVEGTMALLGPADMKRMVPLVLVVIMLVLFLLLKSVRATVATLTGVSVSTIWAFGLMAALNVPIYSVTTMIPVMLIAIGVAYGIYFYNHLSRFSMQHPEASRKDAALYVMEKLWKPLLMAAFTTMIGFISLLTSQVYPIKYFGTFTAFGIFIAFLMAMIFLPSMVLIVGYKQVKTRKELNASSSRFSQKLTDWLLRHRKSIKLSAGAIVIASIIGAQLVWINSSFLDNFEKDSDIVTTDAFVNRKFGGTSSLNLILEANTEDAFKLPENLRLIDEVQRSTENQAMVGSSFSLTDYLKRMHKVMNADDEAFYAIPETSDMVAQYLLLYEMSGDPDNLLKVVNYDYDLTNVTFQLKSDDSKTINAAIAAIEEYRDRLSNAGIDINYAGSGYKALVFSDLILQGQIMSILLSLLLVIILLSLMFRSLKTGIIGAIPIIITAVISFGVMGILNIPLSTATALLSSIAIGIGIDYAIHFLQNYKMNLAMDQNKLHALYTTVNVTGRAILYNAIVVIAGFLVLLFSVFPPNRTLGALVSMNMFTSLIGTLSIMLVMIFGLKSFIKFNEKNKK